MKHRNSIFPLKRLSFSHTREAKAPSKLWNIGKGCIFTIRIDKLLLSTIEIRSLSRPKSSRNLSSDRLETKYERLTSIQRILYFQGKR